MIPKNRLPTHPGEMLSEEFLKELSVSQKAFAQHLGISLQRLNGIINGKRSVTAETAWLLSQALGTSPEFWAGLQMDYDLAVSRPKGRKVKLLAGLPNPDDTAAEEASEQPVTPKRTTVRRLRKSNPELTGASK